jgi:hypothetical protein
LQQQRGTLSNSWSKAGSRQQLLLLLLLRQVVLLATVKWLCWLRLAVPISSSLGTIFWGISRGRQRQQWSPTVGGVVVRALQQQLRLTSSSSNSSRC